MKKSYTSAIAAKLILSDRSTVDVTVGGNVYLGATDAALFASDMTLNDNWRTIMDGDLSVGSSTETFSKTIEELDGVRQNVLLTVAVDSGSAANLPTGSVFTLVMKNAAGATIETRSYTLGGVAAGSSATYLLDPSSLLAADSMVASIELEQDGAAVVSCSAVLTISDIANDVAGAVFTIGSSVAATNPIVTNIQLKDSDFEDLDKRALVEVFALASLDTLDGSLTALDVSTDGILAGTLTANKSILVMSEEDGDIDVTATRSAAGKVRLGVRVGNEIVAISDELIWTT
jgi:hypothetical protein